MEARGYVRRAAGYTPDAQVFDAAVQVVDLLPWLRVVTDGDGVVARVWRRGHIGSDRDTVAINDLGQRGSVKSTRPVMPAGVRLRGGGAHKIGGESEYEIVVGEPTDVQVCTRLV